MKIVRIIGISILLIFFIYAGSSAEPVIYINQVAYETYANKIAVIGSDSKLIGKVSFEIVDSLNGKTVFSGWLSKGQTVDNWKQNEVFYQADFSNCHQEGRFKVRMNVKGIIYSSPFFEINDNILINKIAPAILQYYHRQRANTEIELAVDSKVLLYGSNTTVDLHGGWCDASGDVSKYFSHLAYANFMSPQQIPMITWSMLNAVESIPSLLSKLNVKDDFLSEALWGTDYLMRSLSKDDFFYMIVFSYFNKDPNARRVVGLKANSVTNADYQCAFREGGGMAIAALARASQLKAHGEYSSAQYLDAAKRAFAHLLLHNTQYDDDGKENIIDDYCALMAATELWIATDNSLYRDEARKRAHHLQSRISSRGYFIADEGDRPFWHAADAGLPVIALTRYLKKETDQKERTKALETIKKALVYNLSVTDNVSNPFGYARQSFKFQGKIKDGFFIPHQNETGWWWQGENARLASLAAAALVGGRLVYPAAKKMGVKTSLVEFASRQLDWILGCNPYSMCFLYGFGKNNVPYMKSNFGHGSEIGGISNGITGKEGTDDGSGIDFKLQDEGNEWRWTEQWIPHAAWFLQAITAIAEPYELKQGVIKK